MQEKPYLAPYIKINLKLIIELNVGTQTIMFLGESIGKIFIN